MVVFDARFPNPCPVCGADDEHAAWRAAHPFDGIGATHCPHPGAGLGHGTGCCCGGLPESQPVPAIQPPAADMRYDDEDADEVALVMVRVEYKDGRVREYGAVEPQAFTMNNPETDMTLRPMRMAVQAPGSPVVPMMAAVPSLRLSFRANPRHNMVIRTERTASPRGSGATAPTPQEPAATPPVLQGSVCDDPSGDLPGPTA